MSDLPNTARGQLDSRTARATARLENAENVRAEAEDKQQVADERTAQLKAMRLARENEKS
ncbi:hypothetical protein [Methylobacterium longum]|uniref:Uncharacterized protein n=1 Tax=Methylobacterium longum TaxID=767694 RepID=A0ABT8AZ65_9HYPH|nr:hypothetical protein [Methylobacterium longum]MDN3574855.1 hypothetical protein [Methylobacterium longum]GJE13133.1 hypothetical protein FOHLNKBM_4195 [Methylobacterium longum]